MGAQPLPPELEREPCGCGEVERGEGYFYKLPHKEAVALVEMARVTRIEMRKIDYADTAAHAAYVKAKRKSELEASGTTQLQVTFSMMEIYNEKIRDLLNPDNKTNNDLKVRTTPKGTFVEGCKAKAVGSYKAISDTMDAGTASRTVAATQMNATSARAHTVMTISVKQIISEEGRKKEISSDMNLVDLAGSERARMSGASGVRLQECKKINASLSALGNVIAALTASGHRPHIPYRDSKLTRLLEDSLGGNCKTTMVANVSMALWSASDDGRVDDAPRKLTGETGSLRYMAPEVALSRPYNYKAEVFSYASVVWELGALQKPYEALSADVFMRAIGSGHRPTPPSLPRPNRTRR